MKEFFSTLPAHIVKSFLGKKIWLHLLAIAATYIILASGIDWWWYVHVGQAYESYFFPSVILGALVPIVMPLSMLAIGYMRRSKSIIMSAWGLGQAAAAGMLVSFLYKAFTGRVQPARGNFLVDSSHSFHFGFLEHGVFWGWPSSHTTVAFATAVAFCLMYKEKRVLSALFLVYALFVGVGVSMGIHWFSEFVAGALIGTAVGMTVGRYWRQYTRA